MKKTLLTAILLTVLALTARATQLPPRAEQGYWRDSIPESMRQSYIQYGERYLGKPWTMLPWTVFAEHKTTGNRVNYEQLCFEKRRQLAALVMAEIMEYQGRFMSDIINGLGNFCEETWWGIPAHYRTAVPTTEHQEVDLFNAETASLIAWTRYMLQARLDGFTPLLCQRIDREIQRRILQPALKKDYWWKRAAMNWNPWICSNWLACVVICEHDAERKSQAIKQIRQATQAFLDAYPDDGGCDEGPGYWDRAAASMFEVMRLLGEQWPSQKVGQMAAYAYRTYIGNGYCVNFADAHENRDVQQVNIVYPFGLFINDQTLRQYGAFLAQRSQVMQRPAELYDRSGNFPTLGRELFFLRHIGELQAETPREPLLSDVWLDRLQIMTARRGPYFVAVKGGHNDESHNHNDVGSFVVYADGEPLLIDPGVGEYTAQTFGKDRYSIWTMQSAWHNLPQVNGINQKSGREYAAQVADYRPGRLALQIAGAYPTEAGLSSWLRTVKAGKQGVTITEDYQLSAFRQPVRLMLITPRRPVPTDKGIRLGDRYISYSHSQLDVAIEDASRQLDPLLQRMWGRELYRIVLTVRSRALSQRVSYTIR